MELFARATNLREVSRTLRLKYNYEILDGGELEGKFLAGKLFADVFERQADCLIETAITHWNQAKILRENEQREDRIRVENTSVGS